MSGLGIVDFEQMKRALGHSDTLFESTEHCMTDAQRYRTLVSLIESGTWMVGPVDGHALHRCRSAACLDAALDHMSPEKTCF